MNSGDNTINAVTGLVLDSENRRTIDAIDAAVITKAAELTILIPAEEAIPDNLLMPMIVAW
jgi:hypothetical protein